MHGVGEYVCGSMPVYGFLSFFFFSCAEFLKFGTFFSIEAMCIFTGVPGTNRQYRNNTPSSMEADMLYM